MQIRVLLRGALAAAVYSLLWVGVVTIPANAQEAPVEKQEIDRAVVSLTNTDLLKASDFSRPEEPAGAPVSRLRRKAVNALRETAKPVAATASPTATTSTVPVEKAEIEKPTEKGFDPAPIASISRKENGEEGNTRARSVEPVATSYSTGNAEIDRLVINSANKYGLDPHLIFAVMRQESSFNPRAVSYKGARGLMQLMPATAARLGVRDIHDPAQNIDGGARYLRFLLDTFNGDVELALAGYNAGEGAVARYGYRIPPYRETINYVQRISAHYQMLRGGVTVPVRRGKPMSAAELSYEPEPIAGTGTLTIY